MHLTSRFMSFAVHICTHTPLNVQTLLKRLRLQPPLTSCLRPGYSINMTNHIARSLTILGCTCRPLPSDVQQYLTLWGMDAARIKHCTDSLRTADGP